MTGAKLEYHVRVVLSLKSLSDASTYTLYVSNVQESTVTENVFPILKAIGEIGSSMGDFLPNTVSSNITLRNGYNSLGHQRRFSDLLERYSIIDQQVLVYVAASAIGSFTSADYELRWAGTVKRVRGRGEDVVIDIAGRGIQDRVINTMVSTELFANAPSGSLGYALPVVLGQNVQVKPVLTDSTIPHSVEYAYATNLVEYRCGGLKKALAKAHDGEMVAIDGSKSTSTMLYGNAFSGGKSNSAWPALDSMGFRLNAGALGDVLTGGWFYIYKSTGVAVGDIEIAVYADDLNQNNDTSLNPGMEKAPGTKLGSGVFELSQLSSTAGTYQIRVNFDRPVVLKPNATWFLIIKLNNDTTGFVRDYYDNAVNDTLIIKSSNESKWKSSSNKLRYWGVLGCQVYNTPPTSISRHAGITVDQNSSLTAKPDITKIDWILEVDGLKDSVAGTVTGTAGLLIESAQYAVELLTKQFNGSSYTGGQFGTEHSATWPQVNSSTAQYYRKLAGKTTGVTKLTQFLDQICRASACRITMHPSASTPMGLWAWGGTQAEVDHIGQDDCSVLGMEISGTESIINAVELFYAEKLSQLDYVTGSALGEYKNFSARISSLDSTHMYNKVFNHVSSASRSVFGTKYLDNRTQSWIGDTMSAVNLIMSLLCRYGFPAVYYDIELPFYRFKALKQLDVVRITHPMIAAFFGSIPAASKPVYATGGVEVDLSTGFHWARANSTRFLIEKVSTVFDSENTPRIRASVFQLNNKNDPT